MPNYLITNHTTGERLKVDGSDFNDALRQIRDPSTLLPQRLDLIDGKTGERFSVQVEIDINRIVQAGALAASVGTAREDNPYTDPVEAAAWRRGWLHRYYNRDPR